MTKDLCWAPAPPMNPELLASSLALAVPALQIDASIAALTKDRPTSAANAERMALERRIAFALLTHLECRGFKVIATYDGEDRERVAGIKEAMEYMFNLDEVSVRVKGNGGREHGILFTPGEGRDIVTDFNFSEPDRDGFAKAMEAFDVWAFADAVEGRVAA